MPPPSCCCWHVNLAGVPSPTEAILISAFKLALGQPPPAVSLTVSLISHSPNYAYVTSSSPLPPSTESSLLLSGLTILDVAGCKVKRRKQGRQARLIQEADAEEKRRAKADEAKQKELARPTWKPEHFGRFKMRDSTMDQHVQVSGLCAELRVLVTLYLERCFPNRCHPDGNSDSNSGSSVTVVALLALSSAHPTSLRVKELFETVEMYLIIEATVARLGASPAGCESSSRIDHIFDLACGHGLVGVLLAYRFPKIQVVCVDLVRRPCFSHYVAAFKAAGLPGTLQNLVFEERDMARTIVPAAHSLVLCVHACNEANVVALDLAEAAGAAFAVMPCCIRDGIYETPSHCRRVDDGTRYAVMVGAMASQARAHTVRAIDRRITNRHLVVIGGCRPSRGAGRFGSSSEKEEEKVN